MLVKKSMYGQVESAMLWQIELEKTPTGLGLKPSICDGSTYHDDNNTSVFTHVDDLLILGNEERIEEIKQTLGEKYNTKEDSIKFEYLNNDNELDFLATKLTRDGDDILMNQNAYIDKIVNSIEGTC